MGVAGAVLLKFVTLIVVLAKIGPSWRLGPFTIIPTLLNMETRYCTHMTGL